MRLCPLWALTERSITPRRPFIYLSAAPDRPAHGDVDRERRRHRSRTRLSPRTLREAGHYHVITVDAFDELVVAAKIYERSQGGDGASGGGMHDGAEMRLNRSNLRKCGKTCEDR